MLFPIGSLIDKSNSLQGLINGTLLLRVQVCSVINNSYFPGSVFKSALTGEKQHKQRVHARQRERGIEIEKTNKKKEHEETTKDGREEWENVTWTWKEGAR